MAHRGLEIRATFNGQPILVADSDMLNIMATLNAPEPCPVYCPPNCREHGWVNVQLPPGTRVEMRPAMLSDAEYPDD